MVTLTDIVLTWLTENHYTYELLSTISEGEVFRINGSRKRIAVCNNVVWVSDDWEDYFLGYFRLRQEFKPYDPDFFYKLEAYINELDFPI